MNHGTSPRAWGEVSGLEWLWNGARNIPTGVGRSLSERKQSENHSEHPHGRGEKTSLRHIKARRPGTSPRAWGEVFHAYSLRC